jgi:hypothetical protein
METPIDRRIRRVSESSTFRQVGPASVLVGKAACADRNPTENYDHRAAQQSCEECVFDYAHREYGQSGGHERTFLFGDESLETCRSESISTACRQSSLELLKRFIPWTASTSMLRGALAAAMLKSLPAN